MSFYLNDPKTGKPSVTLSLLIVGFIVATTKLMVSGTEISGIKFGEFSGGDYSTALAALGGLYWARKRDSIKKQKETNENSTNSDGSSGSSPTN